MIWWGRSEIAAHKTLENYQKNVCSGAAFKYSCTDRVYSLLLDWITDTFWKCSEIKVCSKITKIQKNLNCLSFSNPTALQSKISDFSANTDSKKNFSIFYLSVLKYFEICQKKVYNEAIWLTRHFYKNSFIHFSGHVGKTAVMKVLENC